MLHILMVDDEPDLDFLIQQRFRNEIKVGVFQFSFARNGEAAKQILAEHSDIRLLITDLNMPEMNGIQLLIYVKKHHPTINLMVTSAYSDSTNTLFAKSAGATDFLCKPLDLNELEKKFNAHL
jgi:adenylate cyclase